MWKSQAFVKHIEEHLKDEKKYGKGAKVCCKICNKTIDEIFKEHNVLTHN